ncbi:MAG: 3-oxoacyl-ACP reductase family protein [Kiloniellales bacterium]|nr:3-oxoacyl-ACP reductase family protein [Kiloniellales bacterium]
MTERDLSGRIALVTGGSRGIGRAICRRLAQAGAWVAVNYTSNEDAATETLAAIVDQGGDGSIFKADVSSYDHTDAMFSEIETAKGPVDLLVTNAGIASFQDNIDMSIDLWRRILAVNLDGTFHCVWRAKQAMLERGEGRIVCISSINGVAPSTIRPDRLIAYGTSKSAVIGFSRNCAMALGPSIRVNCVAPGLIDTDMTSEMSDEVRQRIIASTPARRSGKPEDIAELTYFLLSDAASFITGQTYVASGGLVTLP